MSDTHLKQFEAAENSLLEVIKENNLKRFTIQYIPTMDAFEVTVLDQPRNLQMMKYVSVDALLHFPGSRCLAFEAAWMVRQIDAEPKE